MLNKRLYFEYQKKHFIFAICKIGFAIHKTYYSFNVENKMRINVLTVIIFGCILLTGAGCNRKQLKLENDHLLAVFDPSNGSLMKLENKKTKWEVIYRKPLEQSFEMLIPLPWKRFHYVEGIEQSPPKIEMSGNKITFTWTSLKSKLLEKPLNITFTGIVELTDNGLRYSGKVINNDSTHTVEYVGWPFWGEVSIPDTAKRFVCESMNQTKELYPSFTNEQGYWGVDYPTQSITLPESAFLTMRNDEQGIIGFSEQVVPKELIVASNELIPGCDNNSMNPTTKEMDGQLVRIPFKVNHFTFTAPQKSQDILPFDLMFYEGSWHKGVDLYKDWKKNAMPHSDNNNWMKEPYTWRYVNISKSQELVDLARECKQYGVSVLHVNGWRAPDSQNDVKGIDGLSSAIKTCQKMGIKIVLDLQMNAADIHSLWYKNELEKYVIINMFGMTTDVRMLCPLTQGMTDIVENRYAKNSDLQSADGIIINDNNNSGATFFCFSTEHGHAVPEFLQTGTYNLDKDFTGEIKKAKPDIAVLGQGFLDTQTTYYDGYKSDSRSDKNRYVNTNTPVITAINERQAREDMNFCLKNRCNICYNFSFIGRELKNYPLIIKYGQEIEALRRKYLDFIWDGEYQDILGASVNGENISYAVYKNKDGRKAVIIINKDKDNVSKVSVSIDGSNKPLVIVSPENLKEMTYNGSVSIDPLSTIVIMEK